MDIIFKRKKITVDCFTHSTTVYDYFPILPATNHFPSWWTDLKKPTDLIPNLNLKTCQGLIGIYQTAFTMRAWSDLAITAGPISDPKFNMRFADGESVAVSHGADQWSAWLSDREWQHLKIISPWVIKSKSDTKFLMTDPMWNRTSLKDYTVLNGVLDFKYQVTSNINLMIPRHDLVYKEFLIPVGSPLVHLVPLTEKQVEFKSHLISKEEFERKNTRVVSFINNFKKNKKFTKESECPIKKFW
jgi:hypothetical protein